MQFKGFGARSVGLCKWSLVMIYRVGGTGLVRRLRAVCSSAGACEERNTAYFG